MVIVRAQEHAQGRTATQIRPGHVLLALLDDEPTRQVLTGIDVDAVRTAVADAVGTGDNTSGGPVPFSPASKKALELGHREALRRNEEHIDPTHILLGVLAMTDEPEVAAGAAVGLDKQQVEAKIPAGTDTPG